MTPFLGEILYFPYNFAPLGYLYCDGSTLPITQYTALFSLLGTTYGGNGTATFQLPDLRGRVPVGAGESPGLSNYYLGQAGGVEKVTLTVAQIPSHVHVYAASTVAATSSSPVGTVPAVPTQPIYARYNTGILSKATMEYDGGNFPHSNIQPYTAIGYCIAISGIFPSRSIAPRRP